MDWLSPPLQGALVVGLIGLVSSLVVLFAARYLRERGEVICEVDGWMGGSLSVDLEERHFRVKLQNKKDVGVDLWSVRAVFYVEGEQPLFLPPRFADTGQDVEVMNLPPREAISRMMLVEAGADHLRIAREAERAELVMGVAGGGELRRSLPHWTALKA